MLWNQAETRIHVVVLAQGVQELNEIDYYFLYFTDKQAKTELEIAPEKSPSASTICAFEYPHS